MCHFLLPVTGVFNCGFQIHLDIKVLPGSNSKALVTKEIVDFQATTAIFDRYPNFYALASMKST